MKDQLQLKSKNYVKEPNLFAVIIHNDEYTTMDFVVEVIVKVFHKPVSIATQIMLNIHENGKGIVDEYTYDIALTKKLQVETMAAEQEFPLKVTIEEVI